jgi:hypothetical protein
MGISEAESRTDAKGHPGRNEVGRTGTATRLSLPRSEAYGGIPDVERGSTDCQGCKDCRVESGHYGTHGGSLRSLSLNELRGAVESISGAQIQAQSPVFPPVSESSSSDERAN